METDHRWQVSYYINYSLYIKYICFSYVAYTTVSQYYICSTPASQHHKESMSINAVSLVLAMYVLRVGGNALQL